MKKLVATVVLLAAVTAVRAEWKSLVGKPAPPLGVSEWVQPADATTTEEFRGRMVLAVFIDPGKPETLSSLLRLQELTAIYGDDGFVVLGLSFADKDAVENLALPFPVGVAGEETTGWGQGDGPRGYLVGPDGNIAWEGDPNEAPDETIQKLEQKDV